MSRLSRDTVPNKDIFRCSYRFPCAAFRSAANECDRNAADVFTNQSCTWSHAIHDKAVPAGWRKPNLCNGNPAPTSKRSLANAKNTVMFCRYVAGNHFLHIRHNA